MSQPCKTPNWWVSEYNFLKEIRDTFHLPGRVIFHDATLRDGEQTPGVVFRKEEKVAIARKLAEVGVHRIEAGMPAVSQEDFEAIKAISGLGLKSQIMVFCRAHEDDIDKAAASGADGVILEVPSGLPRLMYQFNWTEREVIERSIKAIRYAKSKGLYVVFFPYDTTRAELRFLKELVTEVAEKARPDSVTVVDTTGVALPQAMYYLVRQVKQWVDIPVEVHTHNDFGMGVATTIAAVEAGAEVVHVCVNGLGERCGNAALDEVALSLAGLLGMNLDLRLDKLYELAKLVEEHSRVRLANNKPISGEVCFTREIGLGMDVIKKEPTAILPIRPESVGRSFRLVLGKKSGKASIKLKLESMGITADDQQIDTLLNRVKLLSIREKRYLTDDEFNEIIKEVL